LKKVVIIYLKWVASLLIRGRNLAIVLFLVLLGCVASLPIRDGNWRLDNQFKIQ